MNKNEINYVLRLSQAAGAAIESAKAEKVASQALVAELIEARAQVIGIFEKAQADKEAESDLWASRANDCHNCWTECGLPTRDPASLDLPGQGLLGDHLDDVPSLEPTTFGDLINPDVRAGLVQALHDGAGKRKAIDLVVEFTGLDRETVSADWDSLVRCGAIRKDGKAWVAEHVEDHIPSEATSETPTGLRATLEPTAIDGTQELSGDARLDVQILRTLNGCGRMAKHAVADIAAELGVDQTEVGLRIADLEQRGKLETIGDVLSVVNQGAPA